MDAITQVPLPTNEPVHDYAPQSPERARISAELASLENTAIDLPHVIGGIHRMGAGDPIDVVRPDRHAKKLGTLTNATHADATAAIEAAENAKKNWAAMPFDERAAVFLRLLICSPDRGGKRSPPRPCSASPSPSTRPKIVAPASRSTSGVQRRVRPSAPGPAADQRPGNGTAVTTVRWTASSTRSRHSTSPRSQQPAHGAGVDGQHRRVEAVDHPDPVGLSDHAAARGRRLTARGDHLVAATVSRSPMWH